MDILCTADLCPVILNSTCVFYEGNTLVYTGITTNDSIQTALQKIDAKFGDAMVGYTFTNGINQPSAGAPVGLGGSLIANTSIGGNFTLTFTGNLQAAKHITTGGTSSQFVKGNGTLDSTAYQAAGNYITALTGDVIANGPGSVNASLSVINSNPGTYGDSSHVARVTVDNKGRLSAVTSTAIAFPEKSISIVGDVYGSGFTGSQTTLTLNNVNSNVYTNNTFLKFKVNAKGLVTGAAPITDVDIQGALGYVPVPNTRTITINGITQTLQANRSWILPGGGSVTNVSATAGTGISVSVTDPATTPNITITNTAPDQVVSIGSGSGINVTGTYPNFTVAATSTGSVTSVTASAPLASSGGATPNITIVQSTSVADGYLSSTDWNTFNSKQSSGNYITSLTGEATGSGPGAATITLSTPAVTGKILTGVNITGGTVVATDTILQGFGKLQNQINGLIGGSIYQGVWNASTNTPTLTSSVGTDGHYYIVNVAGSTNLNGITDWKVGDWAIFHDGVWQKVDNTDAVVSVNSYTGAVSLVSSDVPEGVTNLYFTNTRARQAISLTTTGSSGAATYNDGTGVLNIPNYNPDLSGYVTIGTNQTITGTKTFSAPVTVSGEVLVTNGGVTGSTGVGYFVLNGASGNNNTAFGYSALSGGSTGNRNTGIGSTALVALTSGFDNTAVGNGAGRNITTGSYNTLVGGYIGTSGLSSNVILSDGQGNIRFQWDGTNIKLNGNTVGSNAYTSTAFLPLTGGTLTGALNGTSASFSADVFGLTGFYTRNSAETFIGTSNSNSGMYVNGTTLNTIIASGGNYTMTLTSAGNVLINTTVNAGFRLDVNGTGRFTGALSGTSATFSGALTIENANINLSNSYYLTGRNSANNTYLAIIGRNSSDKIVIDPDGYGVNVNGNTTFTGNLGIRVASSGDSLNVLGTANNNTAYFAGSATSGQSFGLQIRAGSSITDYSLLVQNNSGADYFRIFGNGAATFSSSVTLGEDLTLTNVGTAASNILATSTSGLLSLTAGASSGYTGGGTIELVANDRSGTNTRGEIYISAGNASSNTANGFIALQTANTERLRVTYGGNVGIGTTAPGSTLSVQAPSNTTSNMDFFSGNNIKGHLGMFANNFYITSNWFFNGSQNADSLSFGQAAITFDTSTANGSLNFATSVAGSTAPAERMRITSAGQMIVGDSSMTYGNNQGYVAGFKGGSASQTFLSLAKSGQSLSSQGFMIGLDNNAVYLYNHDNTPMTFVNNAVERMRITSAGNLLLGTTSSVYKLSVVGSGGINQPASFASSDTTLYTAYAANGSDVGYIGNGIGIASGGSASDFGMQALGNMIFTSGGSTERLRLDSNGNLIFTGQSSSKIQFYNAYSGSPANVGLALFNTAGTTVIALNSNGGGIYTASLGTGIVYSNNGSLTSTNPSDSRLKKNIKSISYGLSDIMKLRPVSYNWESDKINQGIQFGFIAQEVQEIMPDAIKEFGEETKFLGLEKDAIYATLVNAIKELNKKIETLENK